MEQTEEEEPEVTLQSALAILKILVDDMDEFALSFPFSDLLSAPQRKALAAADFVAAVSRTCLQLKLVLEAGAFLFDGDNPLLPYDLWNELTDDFDAELLGVYESIGSMAGEMANFCGQVLSQVAKQKILLQQETLCFDDRNLYDLAEQLIQLEPALRALSDQGSALTA